ncbi:MAG: hypothetical protein ABIJ37_03505 [Pseudomonadota bacterium]
MKADLKERGRFFIILVLMVGFGSVTYAAEEGKLTLEQRMIRLETILEERFNAIDQRFDAIDQRFAAVNQRIDDLNASVKERFSYVYIMLGGVLALLGGVMAIMGVMISKVISMASQDRPVAQKHYERIVKREDEMEVDIRSLKREVDLLKTRLATA